MINPYMSTFPTTYPRQQNDLLFVNGRESAQMYQLPPNSKQILMDRNQARFYLVETDASGQKSVQAYDFKAADDETPRFATQSQVEELKQQYESLAKQISQFIESANTTAILNDGQPTGSTETSNADGAKRGNHARPTLPSI